MALSDSGNRIVELAKGLFEVEGAPRGKVTYEVEATASDSDSIPAVIMKFSLSKPISEEELQANATKVLTGLRDSIVSDVAQDIGNLLLAKQGFGKADFKKPPKIRGVVDVRLGSIADEAEEGVSVGVQPTKGRLVSQGNLRLMLELAMKENLRKEMTSSRAGTGRNSPLRYRTGRFLNSAQVTATSIRNIGNGTQSLSIYYKYMIYPYQVFDPVHTQSPDMNLASNLRNPQRLIGNALARAAATILGSNYKLSVTQVA